MTMYLTIKFQFTRKIFQPYPLQAEKYSKKSDYELYTVTSVLKNVPICYK